MDQVRNRLSRPQADRTGPTGDWVLGLTFSLTFFAVSTAVWSQASEPVQERSEGSAKARVATAPPGSSGPRRVMDTTPPGRIATPPVAAPSDHVARARQVIADCQRQYQKVTDYTCTLFKRERVDGLLYETHVMQMKARTHPSSLYFKFVQPNAGREAIYIQGRNNNKIVAHDVGLGRVVAGTMKLDPKGDMAMEENRHPINEAGIGPLIETVRDRWGMDLNSDNSEILFHTQAKVGDRACLMIEATHPKASPQFLFYKVKLYIDKELNLPIRLEAYDWPTRHGLAPLLMEEYTYMNLKLNVGLKDKDFDASNPQYSYGRF